MEEKLLLELKTTKQKVIYLLENYPLTRNNDFYLQLMFLRVFSNIPIPYIEWEDIKEFSGKLESVRRVRQKIQNDDGMFLPTEEKVLARRRTREKVFRKIIHQI